MTTSTLLNPTATSLEVDHLNESVLRRIAAGERSAVDECLAKYGGLVWSLARQWFKNPADAEDVTQDIFVDIWQSAKRFDPVTASEVVFITMIARRRMIDRLRRSNSKLEMVNVEASVDEVAALPTQDRVELAEEAAKAARCLDRLSNEQRKILSMSIRQGLSHVLISQSLNIPLGTVKSFARRGLIQLRNCMQRSARVEASESLS